MKRKFKLFTSVASLCLAIALMVGGVWAATNPAVSVTGSVSFNASHVYATVVFNEGEDNEDSVTFNAASAQSPAAPEVFEIGEVELTEAAPTYGYTVKITNNFTEGVNVTVDFTKVPELNQAGYTLAISATTGETVAEGNAVITLEPGDFTTISVSVTVDPAKAVTNLDLDLGLDFDLNRVAAA